MAGRSRWFGTGVVVALVCGGAIRSDVGASVSSGERSVFVAITPCRLFDTRPAPDTVGPRSSPLAASETFTIQARGVQGACSLPSDVSGLSLNVAVIGGTADSFLTVFPAGGALPLAANLNWVAGDPPTPNKVDVGLSVDGRVSFYNLAGTVHVAADVNGYYVDHTHDDRYYRKDEADAKYATKTDVAATYATKTDSDAKYTTDLDVKMAVDTLTPGRVILVPSLFVWDGTSGTVDRTLAQIGASSGTVCYDAPAALPHGANVWRLAAHVEDATAGGHAEATLIVQPYGFDATPQTVMEVHTLDGATGVTEEVSTTTIANSVVDLRSHAMFVRVCTDANTWVHGVRLDYTNP